jgi:hypothetical protein
VVLAEAGSHCIWCDKKAAAGERWLTDANEWLYCSAECFALVAMNLTDGTEETRPPLPKTKDYTDAFLCARLALGAGRLL